MNEENKNDHIYVTNVVVSLFSPNRLAGEEQMRELLGLDKIPATMKPLLRQEVIDRKVLNPLAAIKKQVRDALLRYGSREPLLGWVVDPERIDALMTEIRHQEQKYRDAKDALLRKYPEKAAQHLEGLRKACIDEGLSEQKANLLIEVIRDHQPSIEYLKSQIDFRYLEPRVIDLSTKEREMICDSLYEQAIADVAARCKEAARAVRMRPKVRGIEEVLGKIDGLVYLDARFQGLADKIRQMVAGLPKESTPEKDWTPTDQFAVNGALAILSDRAKLRAYLQNGSGDAADFQVVATSMGIPTQPTTADLLQEAETEESNDETVTESSEDQPDIPKDPMSQDTMIIDAIGW